MKHAFSIYLKTYRKRFGLTQKEVADLVGMETGQIVSRHESQVRVPGLETAIAYSTVFEVPIRALLPELYREIEQMVLKRALSLRSTLLAEKPTLHLLHKLQSLEHMIRSIEEPEEV